MNVLATVRLEHDWSIAASILQLIAEVNRDTKKRQDPFRVDEFNPTVKRQKPSEGEWEGDLPITVLKDLWLEGGSAYGR